jgi:hypothetical protein
MNQRYQNSLVTDPNLYLTISATNLLVYTVRLLTFLNFLKLLLFNSQNASSTPWTNTTLCGVSGISTYNGRYTLLADSSFASFSSYMNNLSLSFSYDHAVAVFE